jgi:hypothetical protein
MELSRLTELAKEDSGRKFFSIAHYLTPETLYEAFKSLRKDASAGVVVRVIPPAVCQADL